jgi:catalase
VTARFSDGAGVPTVPDGSPAMPRGIALKYHLPGGADTDMVTNSFKFFPVGTGEDFRDLLQAIVASPPEAPKPTNLTAGIDLSDDPLPSVRTAAYGVSFGRRSQPSTVSP